MGRQLDKFTNEEKADMIIIYGECKRNAEHAHSLYATRFPEREQPTRENFEGLYKMLRKTGRFKCARPMQKILSSQINLKKKKNTYASSSETSDDSDSQSSMIRIQSRHRFHPYRISLHQELNIDDFPKRVEFCEWSLEQNNYFLRRILFINHSTFTNHGHVNKWNMHYWSAQNPHWIRQVEHQPQWSINVMCGIIDEYVIGPYFIDGTLTANKYVQFLKETLPVLLKKVPLMIRRTMWFQHDDHPAYNALISKQTLNEMFPNQWIGQGGSADWPPLSPDLNPLDFFLWGKIKNMVYQEAPTTPEDMKQRIKKACETIKPNTLQAVHYSLQQRFKKCRDQTGHDFEDFL